MAVRFTEGFDDGLHDRKFAFPLESVNLLWGRFGRGGRYGGAVSGGMPDGDFLLNPSTGPTVTFGSAFYIQDQFVGSNRVFLRFYGGGLGGEHLNVTRHRANEQLQVYHSESATLLGVSPIGSFRHRAWHYIEFQFVIDDVAGSVDVRIDGNSVLSVAGVDTKHTNGDADIQRILFWGAGFPSVDEVWVDDIYVTDSSGPAPYNSFLGDIRIATIFPDGNGTYSEQTGSDGNQIDNYLLVDEDPNPDDDTTYVESATVGHRELYNFQNLVNATGKAIRGVNLHNYSRKDDGLPKGIRGKIRTAALDFDGGDQPLNTSYEIHTERWDQNPNTVADWTPAEIDAIEAGQEVRP